MNTKDKYAALSFLAIPTATKAIPTVAEVVYELPVETDTMDDTISDNGKNIDGSIS